MKLVEPIQVIVPFLPGYYFDGISLRSTGIALKPTQFINKDTGELMYYCRPVFAIGGAHTGLYIRHKGLLDWLKKETNLKITGHNLLLQSQR